MYLTESRLKDFISTLYNNIEYNKAVPGSVNKRLKPDIRIESEKLIIEFDGYGHYINPRQILNDQIKDEEYKRLGYTVIRIPYFVQLDKNVVYFEFGINNVSITESYNYPHGFIDKKATLPASFCELGIKRFKRDLEKFFYIKTEIINSLIEKASI